MGQMACLHAQAHHSVGGCFHDRSLNGIQTGKHNLVLYCQVLIRLRRIANMTVEFSYQS